MHTYTESQIKDCEILSKLIEQKTGVKREPNIHEWWIATIVFSDENRWENRPVLITEIFCHGLPEGKPEIYAIINQYSDIFQVDKLLHPLYSEGELLEMIKGEIQKCNEAENFLEGKDIFDKIGYAIISDNILTALLKLAIAVQEGE